MKMNETCRVLCTRGAADDKANPALTAEDLSLFVKRITEEYYVNWMADELPVAATGLLEDGSVLYARGIPVGGIERDTGDYFIYNHHKFTVMYHEEESYEGARVVGVEVYPMSVRQTDGISKQCDGSSDEGMDENQPHMTITGSHAPKMTDKGAKVTFSYDVYWVESDVKWALRWDIYLSMGGLYSDSIHWHAIINSVIIAILLSGLVAMIMVRVCVSSQDEWSARPSPPPRIPPHPLSLTPRRRHTHIPHPAPPPQVRALRLDIQRYNRVMTEEEKAEEQEEKGWKLVHGDVFRPPTKASTAFAVLVGIGAQLIAMSLAIIIFAAVGFLSPANRGSLAIALVLLFLGFGVIAGYTTARTYKMFNGTRWQRTTLLTALGFPGFLFGVIAILNTVVWSTGSVNAISFGYMVAVLAMWLCLSVPLVFLGAFYGFKADKVEFPTRVSTMPRQIPAQPWYLRTPIVMTVGGILPFGTVFVELFFILSSIWLDQYYYVFGFLLLVFVLLLITSAEISIMLTYFQLCSENYHWWWRSMLVPAASGCYLYAYCIYYFLVDLDMEGTVPQLLYFGYMGLVALMFSFVTGTTGYLATLWFVRKIYGAIRVD
jgi:transmembrane 9 superfamily member 2/4